MSTRRDVMKALGLAPIVAGLDWSNAGIERATRFVNSLPRTAEPADYSAYAPKFFTAEEWRTVMVLADYVIPRDEQSGSATDARAPEFVDFMLADSEASESRRLAMRGGLAWLDNESRARSGHTFVDSTDAQRRQILDDIAWPDKAKPEMSHGVAFFNRFRDSIAAAFFSSAVGWKDLRYEGNVFNPNWDGCPEPALRKLGVSYDVMKRRVAPQ